MYSPLDSFSLHNSLLINSQLLSLIILILLASFLISTLLVYYTFFYNFILELNNNIPKWLPFTSTIFILIINGNIIGLIPYSYSWSAMFSITLCISVSLWIGILISSIYTHKAYFIAHFLPEGIPLLLSLLLVPIEIISYIARAISLGIRLSANIISGHLLLLVLMGFIYPLGYYGILVLILICILTILEISVCIIQAYVFVTLFSIYSNEIN